MCNFVRFGDRELPLLVSSDGRDRALFAGSVKVLHQRADGLCEIRTRVPLDNGRAGTLILRSDGVELMEYPDGSRRRVEGGDPFASSRRIAATRLSRTGRERGGLCSVDVPVMSRYALMAGEGSDRYQAEGRAKCEAMTFNGRYDSQTVEALGISHDFDEPGAARRLYGRRVQCLASV